MPEKIEYKRIDIICKDKKEIRVDEFSRFFYYLNNIYKVIYLSSDKDSKIYRHIGLMKLPEENSLKIKRIKKESPIQFELLIPVLFGTVATIKTFVEFLKIIRDWDLDKEKKRLENENFRLTNEKLRNELLGETKKLLKIEDIKIIDILEYSNERGKE